LNKTDTFHNVKRNIHEGDIMKQFWNFSRRIQQIQLDQASATKSNKDL
jgi:hypothetical protein